MSSPEVDQLSVLSRLLGEALEHFRPRDLLLLGCSTGNGLNRVDPAVTRRVTGVDINPAYLARIAEEFPDPAFELTLECADVSTYAFAADALDLVHCRAVALWKGLRRAAFQKRLRVEHELWRVPREEQTSSAVSAFSVVKPYRRLEVKRIRMIASSCQ